MSNRLDHLVRAGLIACLTFSNTGKRVILTELGLAMLDNKTVTPQWLTMVALANHGFTPQAPIADTAYAVGKAAQKLEATGAEWNIPILPHAMDRVFTGEELLMWTRAYSAGWQDSRKASQPIEFDQKDDAAEKDEEAKKEGAKSVRDPGMGAAIDFYMNTDVPVELNEQQIHDGMNLQEGLVGDLLTQGAANFARQGLVTKFLGDNAWAQNIDQRIAQGLEKGIGKASIAPVPSAGQAQVGQMLNVGLVDATSGTIGNWIKSRINSGMKNGQKFSPGQGADRLFITSDGAKAFQTELKSGRPAVDPAKAKASAELNAKNKQDAATKEKEATDAAAALAASGGKASTDDAAAALVELGQPKPMKESIDWGSMASDVDALLDQGMLLTEAQAPTQWTTYTLIGFHAYVTSDPEEVDRQAGFTKPGTKFHLHVQCFVLPITADPKWKAPKILDGTTASRAFHIRGDGVDTNDVKTGLASILKGLTVGNATASAVAKAWPQLWSAWAANGTLKTITAKLKGYAAAPKAGQLDLEKAEAATPVDVNKVMVKLVSTIKGHITNLGQVADEIETAVKELKEGGATQDQLTKVPVQVGLATNQQAVVALNTILSTIFDGKPVTPEMWAAFGQVQKPVADANKLTTKLTSTIKAGLNKSNIGQQADAIEGIVQELKAAGMTPEQLAQIPVYLGYSNRTKAFGALNAVLTTIYNGQPVTPEMWAAVDAAVKTNVTKGAPPPRPRPKADKTDPSMGKKGFGF